MLIEWWKCDFSALPFRVALASEVDLTKLYKSNQCFRIMKYRQCKPDDRKKTPGEIILKKFESIKETFLIIMRCT